MNKHKKHEAFLENRRDNASSDINKMAYTIVLGEFRMRFKEELEDEGNNKG